MPTFSVIVPVYNVEEYIEECITSVLNQTFDDFELICIDDCGKDNSIKMVEEFAKKDDRIKILYHKENKGLSGARNTGLDNAKGKYILFLDSDDWYEKDCLSVIYDAFQEKKTNSIWFDSYKYIQNEHKRENKSVLSNHKGYLHVLPDKIPDYSDYAWVKAYTRESIEKNHLRFPEGIFFEDGEFYFKYFTYNPVTYIMEECLYNYRVRDGSIVTNSQKGIVKIEDIYTVIYHLKDFYIENGLYEKYKKALAKLICKRITTCKRITNNYRKSLHLSDKLLKDFGYPKEFESLKETVPENNLVSVVVPFYKVEKYIEQCVTSIQNQTYRDIEILCIDDCGGDNSAKIIEKLAQNDNRIQIIKHDRNKGLGGARNTGLKNAKGKYIFFVDSDDWLKENCVEKVVEHFNRTGYDTIWYKASVYWENDDSYSDMSRLFPYYARYKQNYVTLNDNNLINFPLYSWNKAYNRQFLLDNDLFWRENVYFEDVEFYFKTFMKSSEIYIIDEMLYIYRRRYDSIISSATREVSKAKDLYFVTGELYKYLKENNLFQKYKNSYQRYICDAINMFRHYPEQHKRLMPFMRQFLKNINYPEDFVGDKG